jgi:hypothetical protein
MKARVVSNRLIRFAFETFLHERPRRSRVSLHRAQRCIFDCLVVELVACLQLAHPTLKLGAQKT